MLGKGYTSEKFTRYTEEDIFKYTDDYSRVPFLQEQFLHLQKISEVLPDNTPQRLKWQSVPNIHYGYFMEYINDATYVGKNNLHQVIHCIERISEMSTDKDILEFETYREYLRNVIFYNSELYESIDKEHLWEKFLPALEDLDFCFNIHTSPCHGDFTVDNLLVNTKGNVIMIDCIYKSNMWSSWLMDVAKFYQNIYFDNTPLAISFSQEIQKMYKGKFEYERMIHLLMIGNYLRMFPYIKNRPHLFHKRYQEFKLLLQGL